MLYVDRVDWREAIEERVLCCKMPFFPRLHTLRRAEMNPELSESLGEYIVGEEWEVGAEIDMAAITDTDSDLHPHYSSASFSIRSSCTSSYVAAATLYPAIPVARYLPRFLVGNSSHGTISG